MLAELYRQGQLIMKDKRGMSFSPDHVDHVLKGIGEMFATERSLRRLSIKDVAEQLKIHPDHIRAIEEGDMENLPALSYIIGYVRNYSTLLEFNSDSICRRLSDSFGEEALRSSYQHKQGNLAPDVTANTGRMALVALVFCMVAYSGWYAWDIRGTNETANNTITIQQVGNSPVLPQQRPSRQVAGDALAQGRTPEKDMFLVATETSWVQLTRADGSVIAEWLMVEGDKYIISGEEDIYLTAGNAGGLQLLSPEGESHILGEWGETVSELPLDVTLISDRL